MKTSSVEQTLRKALILGVLCLSCAGFAGALDRLSIGPAQAWETSPYRNFGAAQSVWGGRVELRDEADDPSLAPLLGAEFKRLAADLHDRQGWRDPIADGETLRVWIARKEAEGARRVAARGVDRGHLASPSIELDATGLSTPQILREVGRLYCYATIAAYGVPDSSFLTSAAADYLSGLDSDDDREAARASAAAPTVDLSQTGSALGGLFVEEFAREAGGPAQLRAIWESAAETHESPYDLLSKRFSESTGLPQDALLLRFGARLYATMETEPSPARVSLPDLQMGALDAASPGAFRLRHRVFLAGQDPSAGALRVSWPDLGSGAAAVVRYRDAALSSDVLFLAAGSVHTIPLSGVSRVDFVIGGPVPSAATPAPSAASAPAAALVEPLASFPYTGLAAQAVAGPDGPRVAWTTASHEGLAGWAVFREEVLTDGRIARTGPEIVPASSKAEESFRYVYLDPQASPATFYRYTIWAVTEDGLLARAFSATMRTAE